MLGSPASCTGSLPALSRAAFPPLRVLGSSRLPCLEPCLFLARSGLLRSGCTCSPIATGWPAWLCAMAAPPPPHTHTSHLAILWLTPPFHTAPHLLALSLPPTHSPRPPLAPALQLRCHHHRRRRLAAAPRRAAPSAAGPRPLPGAHPGGAGRAGAQRLHRAAPGPAQVGGGGCRVGSLGA